MLKPSKPLADFMLHTFSMSDKLPPEHEWTKATFIRRGNDYSMSMAARYDQIRFEHADVGTKIRYFHRGIEVVYEDVPDLNFSLANGDIFTLNVSGELELHLS